MYGNIESVGFSVLQIEDGKITNASILLQIDNANMASEDFRLK